MTEKRPNIALGVVVSIIIIFSSISLKMLFRRKKPAMLKVNVEGKKDEVEKKTRKAIDADKIKNDATSPRKRNARRAN